MVGWPSVLLVCLWHPQRIRRPAKLLCRGRLKRLREELRRHNVTAAVIFDPINIRPRRQFQVASLPMTRSTAQRVLIFLFFLRLVFLMLWWQVTFCSRKDNCQSIEASAVKQTGRLVSFSMRVLRSMAFATHVYFQCLALFEHLEKLRYSAMPYSVLSWEVIRCYQ